MLIRVCQGSTSSPSKLIVFFRWSVLSLALPIIRHTFVPVVFLVKKCARVWRHHARHQGKKVEGRNWGVCEGFVFCSAYPFANILSPPSCYFASFTSFCLLFHLAVPPKKTKWASLSLLLLLMLRRGGTLYIVLHPLSPFLCFVTIFLYSQKWQG